MVIKNIRKIERRKCLCIRCHQYARSEKGIDANTARKSWTPTNSFYDQDILVGLEDGPIGLIKVETLEIGTKDQCLKKVNRKTYFPLKKSYKGKNFLLKQSTSGYQL